MGRLTNEVKINVIRARTVKESLTSLVHVSEPTALLEGHLEILVHSIKDLSHKHLWHMETFSKRLAYGTLHCFKRKAQQLTWCTIINTFGD